MRKMKRLTSVFALLLVASLLVSNAEVLANSSDGKHYTYTYDCWDVDRESPDAYSVERVISGSDFKDCGNFLSHRVFSQPEIRCMLQIQAIIVFVNLHMKTMSLLM